jgi:Fe-S-cluster containining protein
LHDADRPLLAEGILPMRQLVTIRQQEPAHNPLRQEVAPSDSEFIKLKGLANSWSCIFFEPVNNGCHIYRTRPLECRLLFCRNTGPLEEVMGRNLLARRDLLPPTDPVLPLLDRQEEECSYRLVNHLLANLAAGFTAIAEPLSDLVRTDLALRETFLREFPRRETEELFLFGRPLFLVLAPYGIRLVEKDGVIKLRRSG